MAQFRATIQGQRGSASRLGSKKSGLLVTCNGWNGGVTVSVRHDESTGRDVFMVYRTGGSDGRGEKELIADFEAAG